MQQRTTVRDVSTLGDLTLPVRTGAPALAAWVPAVLHIREAGAPDATLIAYGTLARPAPEALTAILRVHNSAGVPIAEGRAGIDRGSVDFIIQAIGPIGLDAYVHLSATRRREIVHRVWSRCAYGTLRLDVARRMRVES